MKNRSTLALVVVILTGLATAEEVSVEGLLSQIDLPVALAANGKADLEKYQEASDTEKVWHYGQPLPRQREDLDLFGEVRFVHWGYYLDGGTRSFLLKDESNRFLAVCSGPGIQTKEVGTDPVNSSLFLGGLHYTDSSTIKVDVDSETYRVLYNLMMEAIKAVDTTAANPRLFHNETSKLTNPDVEAMTEAAVVSP